LPSKSSRDSLEASIGAWTSGAEVMQLANLGAVAKAVVAVRKPTMVRGVFLRKLRRFVRCVIIDSL
jgi:hypothetical protein